MVRKRCPKSVYRFRTHALLSARRWHQQIPAPAGARHPWARRNFGRHLKDNPPKLGSDAISFKKEGYEVALVRIAAFAVRFAGTWPVVNLAAGEGNGEEDD
jgi:hypothetical protein